MVDIKNKGEQLPDDYPIYMGYSYVIEKEGQYDQLISSDITGTVADLKRYIKSQGINITGVCKYKFTFN